MRALSVLLLSVGLILLLGMVHAQAIPPTQGYVTDTANVLTGSRGPLTTQLQTLDNDIGVQIAILTIASTNGEEIATYSGRVFDAWKIGNAEKDNGLLIVLAVQDRTYFIQTGYGLEGTLPDVLVGRIARDEMIPLFQQEKFGEGILAGVNTIEKYLRNDPTVVSRYSEENQPMEFELFNAGIWMAAIVFILFILLLIKFWMKLSTNKMEFARQSMSLFGSGMFTLILGGVFTLFVIGGFYGLTITAVLFLYWLLFGGVPLFPPPTAGAISPGGRMGGVGGFGGGGIGGFGGGRGGGFGGFGGGMSGGGGAGGRF